MIPTDLLRPPDQLHKVERREKDMLCVFFLFFFVFNFYCEMWGFVCLNVVQENLTNNVLSWDKCQGWGGLGFAMQRQGRNKKKKKEDLENEQQSN